MLIMINIMMVIPDNIRILNKVGWAYGFLIDNAYIFDFMNGVEFFLSAVVYINENETLNDGIYEYETLGLPYLAELGRRVYAYELNREKNVQPDFSEFIFSK